jgi:hypothetical protein
MYAKGFFPGGIKKKMKEIEDDIGKVMTDETDPLADYLDEKVSKSLEVDAVNHKIQLSGDSATPGNNKIYGTNGSGTKGWIDFPQALLPQGNWNANTNSPDITGATTGQFWIVSVTGTTDLGGITDWQLNDWAVKTTAGWAKVDNTETGKVLADSADTPAGYLDSKVQDSLVNDAVTHKLKLSGDSATPGNDKVYGTKGNGTKGWRDETGQRSGATDLEVTDTTKGLILKSPDGSRWRQTIDNNGGTSWTKI